MRFRAYEEAHPETKHGATGGGKDGKGVRTKTEVAKIATPDGEPAPRYTQKEKKDRPLIKVV